MIENHNNNTDSKRYIYRHIELLNKKGWYYDMWDAQSEEPK